LHSIDIMNISFTKFHFLVEKNKVSGGVQSLQQQVNSPFHFVAVGNYFLVLKFLRADLEHDFSAVLHSCLHSVGALLCVLCLPNRKGVSTNR